MRFAKIGNSYFNPSQIVCIKADTWKIGNIYRPLVLVEGAGGGSWAFSAKELGYTDTRHTSNDEAFKVSSMMVEEVIQEVERALKGEANG